MKAEGHKNKADELWHSIETLLSNPERNVIAIVELSFGMCHHLIAYGMESKHSRHLDTHAGVCRLLREVGANKIATAFEMLGSLRQGRYYGSKGNGDTVQKTLEIIDIIKDWASS